MADSAETDTIQKIASAARSGRLNEAALMVEQARAAGATDPTLAALGGAVEFHRGQFARAVPLLAEALAHHPADITVRANLAEAQFRTGNAAAALALCDEASAKRDSSLRLAALGGHLAQEAGDFPRAIALYRLVSAARPQDWTIWNNLGNAYSGAGEWDAAVEALRRAASLAGDAPPIRVNLANALYDAGQAQAAVDELLGVAAAFPQDPTAHLALSSIYRESGYDDEAYGAIREAARRDPGSASIQSDFGQEAARRNDYAVAEPAFEAALAIEPALGPAFVGLASVFERMNREDELDPLRDRAVSAGVDAQSLSYIDALRFKRANAIDAAFAALEQSGDVVVAGRKHHLRGIMLDRLGRHDEAFAAFAAMNDHWKEDPSRPVDRAREYRDICREAAATLSPDWIAGWTPPAPASALPTPIFLLGFPRSGTTLLDTMLMADPTVRVLEEEPFIGLAEHDLGGFEAMATATQDQLVAARDAYFRRVADLVGPLDGVQIVDKHPLHLNKVPIIKRLFPDARFVLALRHPCDVVLSCFLTNFRINNAMANFLDLGDAAELYDISFSHWEKARDLFDLPVGTVVYERLVEDSTRELNPLFDWLGLAWPGDQFDHRDTARARGTVSTASYAQVTEPLYKRAAGRWHRYVDHLGGAIPVLQPWVERFGYSVEDGRIPAWPDEAA